MQKKHLIFLLAAFAAAPVLAKPVVVQEAQLLGKWQCAATNKTPMTFTFGSEQKNETSCNGWNGLGTIVYESFILIKIYKQNIFSVLCLLFIGNIMRRTTSLRLGVLARLGVFLLHD